MKIIGKTEKGFILEANETEKRSKLSKTHRII